MITAELLTGFAASLLSVAFRYIPGLSTKYEALQTEYKRLIMAVLIVLTAASSMALACSGKADLFGITLECTEAGTAELIKLVLVALWSNQGTYNLIKK